MTHPHNPNDGWWNRPRRSYQADTYDPCPPRSYSEMLYCTLKARFGEWSPWFMRLVNSAYDGRIPPRFLSLAAKLERERPWENETEDATAGLPPTITIVGKDGSIVARWRPTADEWEASR